MREIKRTAATTRRTSFDIAINSLLGGNDCTVTIVTGHISSIGKAEVTIATLPGGEERASPTETANSEAFSVIEQW